MLTAAAVAGISSLPAFAQETNGATIVGTVRDSSARPVAEADIITRPGNYRARTDSAGRFALRGLDGGSYTVVARKVGYAVDRWDVQISKSGRLEINFVLAPRTTQLDTIVVTAARDCPQFSIEGFMCRQQFGGGIFLDYPDIDDQRVRHTAELFRGIRGFRVDLQPTRVGPRPVAVPSNSYGCITSLVDGRPATAANPIPPHPWDLSAMEVYPRPDSVPAPYQRYTWPRAEAARSGRCSVVVYWTVWAPYTR